MVALAVASLHAAVLAQPAPEDLAGFVTVVGERGAVRVDTDPPVRITGERFSFEENRIGAGEGLRTDPGGSAVLTLSYYGAIVYLEGSSELRLAEPAAPDSGVSLLVRVVTGRAWIVRRPTNDRWLLVAAGDAKAVGAAGYALSKGASLFIEAGAGDSMFAVRRGDARFFLGEVPAATLIDASGELIDQAGVLLSVGQRISTQAPTKPVPDKDAGLLVAEQLDDDVGKFALGRSTHWLGEAEKGDFTPVRGVARATPEPLSVEFEPGLAFDQPRPVFAAPAPRPAPTAVRTALSPSQALIESGVPGTVVAGQRFRRSRIIGSPGTAGTGALVVNPAVELPIRLGRR